MTTALLAWMDNYQSEIAALGSLSAILLLLTLVATPWLVSLLPTDYFRTTKRHTVLSGWIAMTWSAVRNVVGAVFMVLGIVMLVLPGPGVVCFIMGLSLCEFPGKQRFLRTLISRHPSILSSLNWIRAKSGKDAFLPPDDAP